ncbi:response regulator [bacterium]|nr:response regulator [bacterium]
MSEEHPRVLCVDDEPRVLAGLSRALRSRYDVKTAESAADGVKALVETGPFAVVISDMRMPNVDGATFLAAALDIAPDTTRLLLTGQTDLEGAVRAINRGRIFRFLEKPCPPDVLHEAVESAVEQNRLITAERVLLQQTLRGSVEMLTNVLSMVDPVAFGRGQRIQRLVATLCDGLDVEDRWPIEVASMLSQVGSVILPGETAAKVAQGAPLDESERGMAARARAVPLELLANIPRMDPVREILRYGDKRFDGSGPPPGRAVGEDIPLGARLLKLAGDFDALAAPGRKGPEILEEMRRRTGWYDPALFEALLAVRSAVEQLETKSVELSSLVPGMTLVDDVATVDGLLIVPEGHVITPHLVQRIHNFSRGREMRTPVRVTLPRVEEEPAPEHPAAR